MDDDEERKNITRQLQFNLEAGEEVGEDEQEEEIEKTGNEDEAKDDGDKKPAARDLAGLSASAEARDNNSLKLIPFRELKDMIESKCICKECHSPMVISQETYGLANNLYLECCATHSDGRHTQKHAAAIKSQQFGNIDHKRHESASVYTINYLLVIAMMMLGLGIESVVTMLGLLGIRSSIGDQRC